MFGHLASALCHLNMRNYNNLGLVYGMGERGALLLNTSTSAFPTCPHKLHCLALFIEVAGRVVCMQRKF